MDLHPDRPSFDGRVRLLAVTFVLALCALAPSAHAASSPPPPELELPTWQSTYDWEGGDGYFGWHRGLVDADADAYGLETAFDDRYGLWAFPTGDRRYAPGGAEWKLRAPGTTRIGRASLRIGFRPNLFAQHCVRIGLRSGDEVRDGMVTCKPPTPASRNLELDFADPSGKPTATELYAQIVVPSCPGRSSKCDKWIPTTAPEGNGPVLRVEDADLVLVDDDDPSVRPSGPFFELDGTYIDGRETYALRIDSDDAGAGITRIDIEHAGHPALAGHAVLCDPHHRTSGLDSRICRADDDIELDVDTRPMPEGTRRFEASSPDVAGNVGAKRWTVIIDRTPPTTPEPRFTTPEEGSAQAAWPASTDPVLPDGTPGSGVARYRERHRVAGEDWSAWRTRDADARAGEEVWDLPAGTSVDFQVQAVDAVGNASEVATVGGEVFGTPPSVGLSGPLAAADGDHIAPVPSSITVSAHDDGVGVRRLSLQRQGGGELGSHDAGCTPRTRDDGSRWKDACPADAAKTFGVDAGQLPEGRNVLVGGAVDRARNVREDAAVTVFVDRTAPETPTDVELIDFDEQSRESEITWDGEDPDLADGSEGSGVDFWRVYYRTGDGSWRETQVEEPSVLITDTAPGTAFEVQLQAVDAVGNASLMTHATVTVPGASALQEKYSSLPAIASEDISSELIIEGLDEPVARTARAQRGRVPRAKRRATAVAAATGTGCVGTHNKDGMTFGVQTTRTPSVTWGWFFDKKTKASLLASAPALVVTFDNETKVNGKKVSGPGPHFRHFTYTYHGSIRKLGGKKSKRLRFGDDVEIRNKVFGTEGRLRVTGSMRYRCDVRPVGPRS